MAIVGHDSGRGAEAKQHIYVFASGVLSQCYEIGIKTLLPENTVEVVSAENQERAFILGQYLIYKTFTS